MSPFPPSVQLLHQRVSRAVRAWSVDAHLQARRNAMVGLTACTQRRAEREEVERFLAERAAGRRTDEVAGDTSVSLQA